MTSDLVRDPVFGEVARALSVRCDQGPDVAGPSDLVSASFRAGVLAADERAVLVEHGARILRYGASSAPWPEEFVSLVDREPLLRAAQTSAAARALLAASDAATAPCRPPRFQGVVNVTPDSFSDGGRFLDPARAVEHGLALVAEGADLLDVGAESTRPGAAPVPADEELARAIPVVRALARATRVPISIDTTKADVARAALDAGATIVNDVTAGRGDPAMFAVVAAARAGYVAMHMRGVPRDMQAAPEYHDVAVEVLEFLRERCFHALDAGVERAGLWIDPGIGFGKRPAHNLELLRRLAELRSLGLPILLGVSRKSFIPAVTGIDHAPAQRVGGTAAAIALSVVRGAEILRVHDVAVMREAALVARAIAGDGDANDPG